MLPVRSTPQKPMLRPKSPSLSWRLGRYVLPFKTSAKALGNQSTAFRRALTSATVHLDEEFDLVNYYKGTGVSAARLNGFAKGL